MADYSYINVMDMAEESLTTIDGTENIVAFDTTTGKKVSFSVFADYVLQKKTQTIKGASQTVKAALDAISAADTTGEGDIVITL